MNRTGVREAIDWIYIRVQNSRKRSVISLNFTWEDLNRAKIGMSRMTDEKKLTHRYTGEIMWCVQASIYWLLVV